MKECLIVSWAQALDNTSSDHIELRGENLFSEDSICRQEAVSLVYSVTKIGTYVFNEGGVKLIVAEQRFVLEVPSVERDIIGRIAPIVCCGEYDASNIGTLSDSIIAHLENFARRIGRTVSPKHLELVRDSVAALKKKSMLRKRQRLLAIGGSILVLLMLAYLLVPQSS